MACVRRNMDAHLRSTRYPFGALLSMLSSRSVMWLEHCDSRWLAVESYARYPVVQGILCAKTLCPSIFTTRKDWRKHLLLYDHARKPLESTILAWSPNTPATQRARLEYRYEWFVARNKRWKRIAWQLAEDWNGRDASQMKQFEE
jgi:hypothetical protein